MRNLKQALIAMRSQDRQSCAPFMRDCQLCGQEFQHGLHRYEGYPVVRYDLLVCADCWGGNEKGWARHLESALLEHLRRRELAPPPRNAEGLLPRE